jgi:uncharacterized protein (TIGR00251 family)
MTSDLKQELLQKGEVRLLVRVTTNADKTRWRGLMADGAFKIAIAAVPEKGKANIELIKFLAKEFAVLKDQVVIISGASDHTKLIRIKL